MGIELSDLYISMVQSLLKSRFPQLNGLRSSYLQGKELQSKDDVKNKVQIIHCNKQYHWIVVTTVKCKDGQVFVIDSVHKLLNDETKSTVCRLFQRESTPSVIKVGNLSLRGKRGKRLWIVSNCLCHSNFI